MKTKITFLILFLTITSASFGQVVNIPDSNFKSYLIQYSGADTNNDGEIQVSEATNFTGNMEPDGFNITDLTGIQAFTNITYLDAGSNLLSTIDVSQNLALTHLDVALNNLSTIDVSLISGLTYLDVFGNNLSTLNVSTNPSLTFLDCTLNSNLNAINQNAPNVGVNFTYNPVLEYFDFRYTGFTNLSIYNHNSLTEIYCDNSLLLDSVTLVNLSALTTFSCKNSPLFNSLDLVNLSALTTLNCSNTSIASVPTNQLPALENLQCDNNPNLTSLDCSTNNSLINVDASDCNLNSISLPNSITNLNCSSNNLSSIDLNGSPSLSILDCSDNNLNSLNTSFSPSLETLNCSSNNITDLNLHPSSNSLLSLDCSNNQLANLDVTKQLSLVTLRCNDNLITSLSLQFNSLLSSLNCSTNQLEYLDLTGSSRSNLTSMDATNNASLTCIMAEDLPAIGVIAANNSWSKDASAYYGEDCYVYIPDPNFEQALIDVSVDSGAINKYVNTGNIDLLTTLVVSNKSIYDLTGIQKFRALNALDCSSNALTNVDFSQNTNLEFLYCGSNQLTSLSTSANTVLRDLRCQNNELISLDLSNNPQLQLLLCAVNNLSGLSTVNNSLLSVLNCSFNQLTAINITANTSLIGLECSNNQLNSLNTTSNVLLSTLYATDNQISSMNLSSNTALSDLRLTNNSFSDLNLSSNTSLTRLFCGENQLTSLDISQNSSINWLICNDNNLTDLNIANGNNANMPFMYAYDNSLTCIQVDDENNSPPAAHDWQKDAVASYSDDCTVPLVTLLIEPTVILQGPMLNSSSELMNDDLRAAGLLPTTSPYADAATVSSTVFDSSGTTAIVDWVWVELRDENNSSNVIAAKSALINRKGYVLNENNFPLEFEDLPEGNYYIAINHRNHLGILSANTLALSDSSTSIDLVSNSNSVNGGSNAVADLGNGIFAMYAGDYDGNGQIQNTDLTILRPLLGQPSSYDNADLDMNSQVQNTDINNILNPNKGRGQQFSRLQNDAKIETKKTHIKLDEQNETFNRLFNQL
jgi:Leucine-rich repeat (LRR) protein